MKKSLSIALMLCFILVQTSCSGDDAINKEEDIFLKYKGIWNGTYLGDDEGTWTATIDETGHFSGTVTSDNFNTSFVLEGNVDQKGKLMAVYKNSGTEIGIFEGNITKTSGTGTWTNRTSNLQGSWAGEKN